ncbi:MAG: tRNA (adenosine(37)-N6)-threonylcarbamoyltransferase complex ATPase subunit type 1 TsaE [Dehalococcoidia bacterium]
MERMEVHTASAEETQALGRRLGEAVHVGDLILLHGDLGAGKTTLTQGLAWGAGVQDYAHSPTFVLVHEYAGRVPVYHMDLYRIEGGLEAQDLGIEEMLQDGVCVVEWPEKAEHVFPSGHLAVYIAFGETPEQRRIVLETHGQHYDILIERLQAAARL